MAELLQNVESNIVDSSNDWKPKDYANEFLNDENFVIIAHEDDLILYTHDNSYSQKQNQWPMPFDIYHNVMTYKALTKTFIKGFKHVDCILADKLIHAAVEDGTTGIIFDGAFNKVINDFYETRKYLLDKHIEEYSDLVHELVILKSLILATFVSGNAFNLATYHSSGILFSPPEESLIPFIETETDDVYHLAYFI
jgi:hypothetical protein